MTRTADLLVRSMRACLRLPRVFDLLKAAWIYAGMSLLKLPALRAHSLPVVARDGFVLSGSPTASILNRIILYRGVFEPTLSAMITANVRPGDTCLDLGANVGYFTLLLGLRAGPTGTVVAVEASPGNIAKLRANVAANGFEGRVRIVHAACTDRSGEIPFQVSRDNDMHSRLELPTREEPFGWFLRRERWRRIVVPAMPLADVLAAAGIAPASVRFIKLDIEGAEDAVIPQVLALCTHPELMVALEARSVTALRPFREAGFHVHDLRNDYRWLLNADVPAPRATDYEALAAERGVVDVFLSRRPLAAPGAANPHR